MRRILRAVDIHSHQINSRFGITTPQLLCLHALEASGPLTLSELSKLLSLSSSTVLGIVDRLEAKNLIRRERLQADRRKVLLQISEEGLKVTRDAPSLLQKRFSISLAGLEESERLMLTGALERVVELMGVNNVDASPNLISTDQINPEENDDNSTTKKHTQKH